MPGLPQGTTREKVAFINLYQNVYKLSNICAVLNISQRTYYKYRNSEDKDYYDYLMIKEIFEDSKYTYGSRRIAEGLKVKYGVIFNRKKIQRIMNKYYLKPRYYKEPKYNNNKKCLEENVKPNGKITRIDNIEKADVVFDHVNFGYTPERTIINDFNFTVYPGHHVAIVGPTGAGKTTLVNLLMRFYELNSGSISIGGIKTSDMTRECVHSLFCMVLQDTWLFNGTVRDNLTFGKQHVTDEEVIKACKSVGIHRYIMSLPDSYDTVLSDDSNMSVGQRQLMTIARAMITNAPLPILDEATSSVDTRTEQIVQDAMNKLTEGRISFTIAHRLSTIRNADIILVMKDGDIVETGNHRELLEKNGFYAELWNSQFTEGEDI